MNSYSTATVQGMTRIPMRTIQEYVKSFRDCFSETARQPAKGRRFTDQDVNHLLTIKRLRAERLPDEEARKFLTGEATLPLAEHYHEADIKQLAAGAAENLDLAIGLYNNAQDMIAEQKTAMYQIRDENTELKKQVKALEEKLTKVYKWQMWVMKNEPALNPDEVKPGLLERLLGTSEE